MARHLDAAGGPTTVCPVELALEVGIRASSTDPHGKKSHLVHAIDRLAHNHVVACLGDRILGVRQAIPPGSERTLEEKCLMQPATPTCTSGDSRKLAASA
jgi:hypothetical protein